MPKTATTTKKTPSTAPKKAAPKAKAKSDAFAVIATGGKQYKVSEGDLVKIEKIIGEHKEGDTLTFDQVLLVENGGTTIGTPTVPGAKVTATLEKIGRAQKVVVIKYKQKSRYFKKNGHRQPFFQIKVTSIK
jgi:large subunit ribosomal protein L21